MNHGVRHGEDPAIADVGIAAFETPSGALVLYCAIVAKTDIDRAALADRLGKRYLAPIKVVAVGQIPRNSMGKLQRDQLKAEIVRLGG